MGNEKIIYADYDEYLERKLNIEKNFLLNFSERVDEFFSSSGRIELLGKNVLVDNIARNNKCSPYEIVTLLNKNIKRIVV